MNSPVTSSFPRAVGKLVSHELVRALLEQHTIMWVYEETPPRAVHRVIAYDARYQPIRLNGVSGEAPVALVPAPPSAVQRTDNVGLAAAPRQAPRATPRPTVRPTVR